MTITITIHRDGPEPLAIVRAHDATGEIRAIEPLDAKAREGLFEVLGGVIDKVTTAALRSVGVGK